MKQYTDEEKTYSVRLGCEGHLHGVLHAATFFATAYLQPATSDEVWKVVTAVLACQYADWIGC